MKPIIIVMLCVQVLMVLAVLFAVTIRKPTAEKPVPIWSSLALSLFVGGMASTQIATSHDGGAGVDILMFGGAVLIGMALMCLLLSIRQMVERRAAS